MSFSPQVLLSSAARERCVSNLKQLPYLVFNDSTINAAVLVPLCVVDGEVNLLYTLRSSNLKSHSGQVSFPGGKRDGDETVVQTALRETEEEIGVPRENVEVWTEMSTVQGRNSEILITPVVGVIKDFSMDQLTANVSEVEEIFTVPMSELCNPNNHAHLDYKPPLPVFVCGRHKIWGITGLITHMFLNCFISEEVYKVNFKRKKYKLDELMPSKL